MKKLILYPVLLSSVIIFQACKKPKDVAVPDLEDSLTNVYGKPGSGNTAIKDSLKQGPGKNQVNPSPTNPISCGGSVNLMAGQHTDAGDIVVTNDATNLYVTYNTTDGWILKETHLYVGNINNIPKGNGNFPYTNDRMNNTTSYTYTIPLSSLGGSSCVAIAAHASVALVDANGSEVRKETGWSSGISIPGSGNWSMYADYCLCDETTTGGNSTSGTTTSGATTTGSTTSGSATSGSTTSGSTTSGSTTTGTTTSGSTTSGTTTGGSPTTGGVIGG